MGLLSWLRFKKPVSGTSHSLSSSKSLPLALFPVGEYNVPVSLWAKSIQALANNNESRLRRIVHCKATSGSRHEFLLVYIWHPSGKESIILAERDSALDTSPVLSDDVMHPQGPIGGHAFPASRDRVGLSYDGTTQCITRHIPSWAELHTLRFSTPSKAPSVAHFAALLTSLNRHTLSPDLSAEKRSSWFAYCVVEVMKEVFGGEAKASKKWVRVPYGGAGVDNRDTVDALVREFSTCWEDFSRRRVQKDGGGSVKKARKSEAKRQEQKEMMNSFAAMLRNMDS
ncbi:hypothetical protein PAXRUDRAFT_834786 [Paxillus rubicundulus Ve08.2h10]|uniref:Uncharacterized protein n=1 Tax=Paxillus rubicundulus Ve08.2h10 TaxID=930991 RepID=A0A0D0CRJ6_9AGAM|nr:hypothetical protein PAXRUDRAFT_834786 [Paxillus rubicundulus Ve08.2h10]